MQSETKKRWIIYAIIVIGVCLALWAIRPSQQYLPHGMFLSTQKDQQFTANKGKITVYRSMPVDKDVIGKISIMLKVHGDRDKQQQQMRDYAKKLAAQHGAMGIVLLGYYTPSSDSGPLSAYQQIFAAVR